MTTKRNKPYDEIVYSLNQCPIKSKQYRYANVSFEDISPLFEAWDALSQRQKIKAVKDSRWNHYPLISWTPNSPKRFGEAIGTLVKSIVIKGDEDSNLLEKHSTGVFAIYMLDTVGANARINMAKRLRKSPDTRIRTRCVKILPPNFLKRYMADFCSDKHYSVRNIAISRFGLDNCYKMLLPKIADDSKLPEYPAGETAYWSRWLCYQAVDLADLEDVKDLLPHLEDDSLDDRTVASILKKISKEDILYYLNNSALSRDTFEAKVR
jgi:hypothetical protein